MCKEKKISSGRNGHHDCLGSSQQSWRVYDSYYIDHHRSVEQFRKTPKRINSFIKQFCIRKDLITKDNTYMIQLFFFLAFDHIISPVLNTLPLLQKKKKNTNKPIRVPFKKKLSLFIVCTTSSSYLHLHQSPALQLLSVLFSTLPKIFSTVVPTAFISSFFLATRVERNVNRPQASICIQHTFSIKS